LHYSNKKYRISYINQSIQYGIWNQSGRNWEEKGQPLGWPEWCKGQLKLESEFQRSLHLAHIRRSALVFTKIPVG